MKTNRVRGPMLAAVIAGAFLLAACGDDNNSGGAADTTATTAAATTVPAGGDTTVAGTTPAASDVTIALAKNDTLGDVLVDGNGRALYLFEKDNGNLSACTGGCAASWPALMAQAPAAGDGVDASLLGVSNDGQVTYNGHLLYYFAGDLKAGDMNGVGIPSWYLVTAAGESAE